MNPDWELEVSDIVIDVDCTFWSAEKDGAAIRRPLNNLESDFELFSPKACSFDGTDNHSAIFIHDADLFAIGSPAHVGDDGLVAVVNHLFEPVGLVQHPHDNEALLV